MCLHMLKHCEFEKYMNIYANANCKYSRCMKRQNIENLYQKQKYSKYELCKKYILKICLASQKQYQGNLAPYILATGQSGTGQFGTMTI